MDAVALTQNWEQTTAAGNDVAIPGVGTFKGSSYYSLARAAGDTSRGRWGHFHALCLFCVENHSKEICRGA